MCSRYSSDFSFFVWLALHQLLDRRFTLYLGAQKSLYTVEDGPLRRVNAVAKRFKHVVVVCWFASLSKFHRLFFLLTQLIEFYKEKSNLMNIKHTLLTNVYLASISLLTQFELTSTLYIINHLVNWTN